MNADILPLDFLPRFLAAKSPVPEARRKQIAEHLLALPADKRKEAVSILLGAGGDEAALFLKVTAHEPPTSSGTSVTIQSPTNKRINVADRL